MQTIKVFYREPGKDEITERLLPIDEAMLEDPPLTDRIIKRELGSDIQIVSTVYPKSRKLQTI